MWKGTGTTASSLVALGLNFLDRWTAAQVHSSNPLSVASIPSAKWTRPPENYVKCNVDAGLFTNQGKIGSGMLLRDYHGTFLAAKSCWQRCSVLEPFLAEAISLREALSWLKDLCVHSILIESDSLSVVSTIKRGRIDDTMFGMLIADFVKLIKEIPCCKGLVYP